MGAIVAIIGEAGDSAFADQLDRMLARSPYRGAPERHIENGVAIAIQTRGWDASLATIGNWTVAIHGIIGNWSELTPEYKWDFPDRATNATKLAIAYEHLGSSLFSKLRGEFSILIHDRREGHIIAVRDLWGRRPLFFERTPSRTYIASEIRQIRAGSRTPNRIDGDVLIQDLLWNPVYPTRTHVKGVGRFKAGRLNSLRHAQAEEPTPGLHIWDPPEGRTSHRYDFDSLVEELSFLLIQAVNRYLVGVPFAVSLSGGVDSSTIWWAISKKTHAGDESAARGKPFSCTYPKSISDEQAQIERVLSATKTDNRVFVDLDCDDVIPYMTENATRIDCPTHVAATPVTRLWDGIRADDRTLVLDGFGGDVLFGGSPSYIYDLFKTGHFIRGFSDLLTQEPRYGQSRFRFIASMTASPLKRLIMRHTNKNLQGSLPTWVADPRRKHAENRPHSQDPYPRALYRHQKDLLGCLRYQQCLASRDGFEQLMSSNGIESASPLIDLDLLDFAYRCPPRAFSNGGRYKQLLRAVAYDKMGPEIHNWENPPTPFFLKPHDVVALEKVLSPPMWYLSESNIVDSRELNRLFSDARDDITSADHLGVLAVAELVVGGLLDSAAAS